jgi:hypothetical protein
MNVILTGTDAKRWSAKDLVIAKGFTSAREILRSAQNDCNWGLSDSPSNTRRVFPSHRKRRHGGAYAVTLAKYVRFDVPVLHPNRALRTLAKLLVVRD